MSNPSKPAPAIVLRQLAHVMRVSRALYAAAELDIAGRLVDGPKTSAGLAATTGTDPIALRRLLRALVAQGVFDEIAPDWFSLNPAADLLRRDAPGSQRAGVLFAAGQLEWRLWSDFLESVRTGRSAVERAFGKTVFERHAESAEERALFSEAMASFSAALSAPVIAAYDFGSFRRIADVGGGKGRFLADILTQNPNGSGVLFDLPHVVADAPPLLAASGVAGRCEVVAGSFFESVPEGADLYILRAIVHDWDDERATALLAACRRAMGADARLAIVERVLPDQAEAGLQPDAYLLDLEMMVNTPGGRERTRDEFHALLAATQFAATRFIPTAAPVWVIETRPV